MQENGQLEPIKLDSEFMRDPRAVYALLRKEGPVRQVVMPSGEPGWLVTSYDDARALLGDPRLGKDFSRIAEILPASAAGIYATPLAATMLSTDPPDHTRLRKLVTKAFTARSIAGLRPVIEQTAEELLGAMAAEPAVDLLTAYALPLPIAVISHLLGVPKADHGRFRDWTLAFVSVTSPEELAEAERQLAAFLAALVEDKRAHPGDDLLSRLTQVADEGSQLSADELLSMAFLLLTAGFETTVNLIANGVLSLLRHPGQLALLQSDPGLLPDAVEEFLRYDGPVHVATFRFTREPVHAGGADIPPDQLVLISLLAANRDESRFPDPDRLDITRPAGGHLTFGHGIHHCLGAPLARLEGQIAIGRLLGRFPGLTLATEPSELRWRDSTLMHGLHSLPVRLGTNRRST
jgi:cytochrome P450